MKKIILLTLAFCFIAGVVFAQNWNSNPYNQNNSPFNYDNSPFNHKNSPFNYDNSPFKPNNDRIIRDNQGRDTGLYSVPRSDGGSNIFDRRGNRRMYIPGNKSE